MGLLTNNFFVPIVDLILKLPILSNKISNKHMHQMLNKNINIKILNQIYGQGHSLLYNAFTYNNKTYPISGTYKNEAIVNNYLNLFSWMLELSNVNTQQSYNKLYELFHIWATTQRVDHGIENAGIISQRIFHIISSYHFIKSFDNNDFILKIHHLLKKEISYLLSLYKKKCYIFLHPMDYMAFFKIIIIIESSKPSSLNKIIKNLNKHLIKNISDDGGHVSSSISTTLFYLQNLLIIKDVLNSQGYLNINIINSHIDKISLFIKMLKYNNDLFPIFSQSYEENMHHINSYLSLHNTASSNLYYNLKDTKYAHFKHKEDNNIIISYNPKLQYFFPMEILLHREKIITNIPNKQLFNLKEQEINPKNYSTLILENEEGVIKLNPKECSVQSYKRDEENWSICEFTFDSKEFGFIYRRTIYLSKNDNNNCVLGEDLISLKKNSNFKKIKRAYLRFHINYNIYNIEFHKNNYFSLIKTNNNLFIFNSIDNPIKASKSTYCNLDNTTLYTLDIDFDLNKKIIKNEWNIISVHSAQ